MTDEERQEKWRENARSFRRIRKAWLAQIKHEVGCERCGTKDAALHFHHRDPAEKSFAVMSGLSCRLATMVTEIEKCDILCHGCHWHEHRSRGSKHQDDEGRWCISFRTPHEAEADRILALIQAATSTALVSASVPRKSSHKERAK